MWATYIYMIDASCAHGEDSEMMFLLERIRTYTFKYSMLYIADQACIYFPIANTYLISAISCKKKRGRRRRKFVR